MRCCVFTVCVTDIAVWNCGWQIKSLLCSFSAIICLLKCRVLWERKFMRIMARLQSRLHHLHSRVHRRGHSTLNRISFCIWWEPRRNKEAMIFTSWTCGNTGIFLVDADCVSPRQIYYLQWWSTTGIWAGQQLDIHEQLQSKSYRQKCKVYHGNIRNKTARNAELLPGYFPRPFIKSDVIGITSISQKLN